MDINTMYQICQYAINKAQNGYFTPDEFNLLANQAQISYMDYLLGEFQQYQYGRPQARVNYSQNSDTRQRLTPFIKQTTLTIDSAGHSNYPSNYLETDAIRTSANDRIRFVQQDSLYSYLKSGIDPVATNPIYLLASITSTYSNGGFQFYPINLGTAILDYIIITPTMLWAYTLDGNGRPVYNAGASIQPLWYDVDRLEIISRILKLVGVNLQIAQVEQYANQITQTGQ
jgi:hypothetical protein